MRWRDFSRGERWKVAWGVWWRLTLLWFLLGLLLSVLVWVE